MKRADWIWMPHAAQWCIGDHCRFHLATWVGNYIVSTVGEWLSDSEDMKFKDIAHNAKYESMVFPSTLQTDPESKCCPYTSASWMEIDVDRYNDPIKATKGHMRLCEKWAKSKKKKLSLRRS